MQQKTISRFKTCKRFLTNMIGRVNHIAIVVPDLIKSTKLYNDVMGAKTSEIITLQEHGVRTVFVKLDNTNIELLYPIDNKSPIYNFFKKNPNGAMHHICYEVYDIIEAKNNLLSKGMKIIGDDNPKIGAHGKPVIFLDPKSFDGVLIELEEI
tara:strand:- start:433 stop:891 length:459 start_codon:yes stop_codon:yes gene_type:complete